MAVKSVNHTYSQSDQITSRDFGVKYYFELLPKRIGGEQGSFKVCRFGDYAPSVF